jgi:hypothetical protein
MADAASNTISFPEWIPSDFEVVRAWIYAADASKLCLENVASVFACAEFFLLESLQEECVEMLFGSRKKATAQQILAGLEILSTSQGFRKYQNRLFEFASLLPLSIEMVWTLLLTCDALNRVIAAKDKNLWRQKGVTTAANVR